MNDHDDVGDFDGQDLGAYVAKVRERDQHHGKAEAIRLARWVLTEATKRGLRQHAIDRLGPYAVMIGATMPSNGSDYRKRLEASGGRLHTDPAAQRQARERGRQR